jgi:hypothetical protein
VEIEGFNAEQIDALCDMWNLGKPIDVAAFLKRKDITKEAKMRVCKAGQVSDGTSKSALAAAHRLMQAAILTEVAKLDRKRWNPESGRGHE